MLYPLSYGGSAHRLVGPRWQGERVSGDEEHAVEAVSAALVRGDHAGLRRLLHPYLHWTGADGVTVRRRTKVLALLDELTEAPDMPTSVELRDGQVYRWQSG